MGDNSIFSVLSIIYEFENSPSIPSFLVTKIVYVGYGQLKRMTPFPFTFA
jgi:hypothetical protein